MRAVLVRLHRYAGLVLAGFLIDAGLTGALLAWNDEIEALLSPQLFVVTPASEGAPTLDPLVLRERVQAAYPRTFVARAPLRIEPGQAVVLRLYALPDRSGVTPELANDQVFVDPYTGRILGERKWGDPTQGIKNLMPFVQRLHDSLALGDIGAALMGMIALLWTVDCFTGAWLTMPPVRLAGGPAAWAARWRRAWCVRWRGGRHKLVFDLHRAAGLWPWAMLFVFAWSSVAFNLRPVYAPVMQALFAHQPEPARAPPATPLLSPPVDWQQARALGREYLARQAAQNGWSVQYEYMLIYDPRSARYRYYAHTDRDAATRWGLTRVEIDGRSGAVLTLWQPTGAAAGDTAHTWLTTLHMAAVGGRPMQALVCVIGIAVALLSVTGWLLWLRKRRARGVAAAQKIGPPSARWRMPMNQEPSPQEKQ
jgi:uncharacterized iron-regulated membrane protein